MMTRTRKNTRDVGARTASNEWITQIPMKKSAVVGQAWDPEVARAIHALIFEANEAAGLLKDYAEDEDLPKQCARILHKRIDAAVGELEALLKVRDLVKQRESDEAEGRMQE